MSYSIDITKTFQRAGVPAVTRSKTYTADSITELELAIPDSTTDQEVVLAIDVSAIVAIIIDSDQAVTIETNSGSAADDTLTPAANVPLLWTNDDEHANPFTSGTDVASLFITNASGATANIKISVLQDSTP